MLEEGNCYFFSSMEYTKVDHFEPDMAIYQKYFNKVKSYQTCTPGMDSTGAIEGLYTDRMNYCKICPQGFFQSKATMSEWCVKCDDGQESNYHDAGMTVMQDLAGVDYYAITACRDCPAGKHSDLALTSCQKCERGTYAKVKTHATCPNCPKGTYDGGWLDSQTTGLVDMLSQNNQCKNCPGGWISAGAKAFQCTICNAGHYATGQRQFYCPQCDWGKYVPDQGAEYCKICQAGKSTEHQTGRTACTSCPNGKWAVCTSPSGAETDPPTAVCSNSHVLKYCKNCEIGKWNPNYQQTTCLDCPGGKYTNIRGVGTTECPNCPAGKQSVDGQYFNHPDACTQCDGGKYSPGTGWALCKDCQVGRATPTGVHTCPQCGKDDSQVAEGSFQDETGKLQCKSCAPGYYQDDFEETACKLCQVGRSRAEYRLTACANCEIGKHQDQTGKAACKYCPGGRYENDRYNGQGSGAVTCKICNAGKYLAIPADNDGDVDTTPPWDSDPYEYMPSENCKICPQGRKSETNTLSTVCVDCQGGYYASSHSSVCHTCDTGQYAELEWHTCKNCPSGHHMSSGTSPKSACAACGAGKSTPPYPNHQGKAECTNCPNGWFGEGDAGGTPDCGLCPLGTKSNSGNGNTHTASCEACPAGKYTGSGMQSGACTNCPAGYFAGAAGFGACSSCQEGYFDSRGGAVSSVNTACNQCPAGWFQNTMRETSCTICPNGHISTGHRQSCQECATNQFTSQGATSCTNCPGGFVASSADYFNDRGQSNPGNCVACPAGFSGGEEYLGEAEESSHDIGALCAACPAGKGAGHADASGCQNCEAGKYSSSGGGTCVGCPAGFFDDRSSVGTNYAQTTPCKQCPAGYHQNDGNKYHYGGTVGCKACGSGQTTAGETNRHWCWSCPSGWSTISHPYANCNQCSRGQYSGSGHNGACNICPNGWYSPNSGVTYINNGGWKACDSCPNGWYTNQQGSAGSMHGCKGCPAGKRPNQVPRGTSCTSCPSGHYSQQKHTTTSCHECSGNNQYAGHEAGSCSTCTNQYYSNRRRRADGCSRCQKGQSKWQSTDEHCETCPSGRYQGSDNSNLWGSGTCTSSNSCACTYCPAGQASHSNRHSCYGCPGGQYASGAGWGSCSNPPANHYVTSTSSYSACPGGQHGNGNSNCRSCPGGWYQNQNGQGGCKGCPSGHYRNGGGYTSCGGCPSGQYQDQAYQSSCKGCSGTVTGSSTGCQVGCTGTVKIYEHYGSTGWEVSCSKGDTNMGSGCLSSPWENDRASSIYVPDGCQGCVYMHSNYDTLLKCYTGPTSQNFDGHNENDQMSSIKVLDKRL